MVREGAQQSLDDLGVADVKEEDVPTLPDADPEVVAARAFEEGGVYAALMQIGVGSVKPRFETRVTITEREFPRMVATGGGDASDSSFEMESGMTITGTETGSQIEWWTNADVVGRIAQLGSRVLNPVADKIVTNFFSNIERQMNDLETEEGGESISSRLRNLI